MCACETVWCDGGGGGRDCMCGCVWCDCSGCACMSLRVTVCVCAVCLCVCMAVCGSMCSLVEGPEEVRGVGSPGENVTGMGTVAFLTQPALLSGVAMPP